MLPAHRYPIAESQEVPLASRQSAVDAQPDQANPWPFRLAVMLCCATFPLISIGGLVTSYNAGMAVPDWPNTYGYNLLLYPYTTWLFGPWDLFLEHGHRLLGVLTGLLSIGLVAATYYVDSRKSMRKATVAALVAVIAQGGLGGARVLLDDRQLAMLHGCVGPAFFAYCVGLASCLAPKWQSLVPRRPGAGLDQISRLDQRLRRFTLLLALLFYVQLVLGAQLRHVPVTAGPWLFNMSLLLHLTNAVLLTLSVTVLGLSLRRGRVDPELRPVVSALVVLLCIQLILGVTTWVVKYGWPYWFAQSLFAASFTVQAKSMTQTGIATLHMAVGSLILAVAVLAHVQTWQLLHARLRNALRQTTPGMVK